MKDLKLPTTNTQEVLYTLIKRGDVSILDFAYLPGFRTRVSEIINKYGLNLKRMEVTRYNKFGNPYRFAIHALPNKEEKEKAINIYKKLTKD